jgi:hypothetical protein
MPNSTLARSRFQRALPLCDLSAFDAEHCPEIKLRIATRGWKWTHWSLLRALICGPYGDEIPLGDQKLDRLNRIRKNRRILLQKYLYAVQPDFLYSVSRNFIKNCRTPMLVLPDDVPGHPLQTSIDVASLAPNAEITVYPWKEPEELRQRTIDRVHRFLKPHIPMRAAAQ